MNPDEVAEICAEAAKGVLKNATQVGIDVAQDNLEEIVNCVVDGLTRVGAVWDQVEPIVLACLGG